MRKIGFVLLSMFGVLTANSQEASTDSLSIDAAFNACIAMRDAVAKMDSAAIKQSVIALKAAGTTNFNSLRCKDDSIASLNGHLVFDEAFADSLAEGKNVYDRADDMNRAKTNRGQYTDGKVHTKTCFVKAGKSTRYSFASKGHQELAVVAEAGGLVTMKVHVTNTTGLNKRFDDTKKVKKGMPQRKTSFELPTDRRNTVELEIVNCSKKDCSFVVISN